MAVEGPLSIWTFDIFQGVYGRSDVMWIEAVDGLAAATERMDEIAFEQPGKYFLFSANEHKMFASTDTTDPR